MEQIIPFYLILKFFKDVPRGSALDIGSGMGKNSFFLAQNGFDVEAIDIDGNCVKNINEMSEKNNWQIKAIPGDIRQFDLDQSKYSLILAIQCFNFIKKSEFDNIIEKIKSSLKKDGIMIISAFTVADNSYKKLRDKHEPVEENTFFSKNSPNWWHFFGENELKKYFSPGFEILHYEEKIIEDREPQPHSHGIVEMVIKKT